MLLPTVYRIFWIEVDIASMGDWTVMWKSAEGGFPKETPAEGSTFQ